MPTFLSDRENITNYTNITTGWSFLAELAEADELGTRHNSGKLRYDLIPPEALEALATVCGAGAEDYGVDNWLKGMPHRTTYGSLFRHLQSWWKGEDIDPKSTYPHSWHLLWNAMAMVVMERRIKDGRMDEAVIDNRPYKMPPSPSASD